MRPDRIVVGEVRGAEALDLLMAMNTGHDGALSTVHANSPGDALARLETLVLLASSGLPLAAVRAQLVAAVDAVVHVTRLSDGTRQVRTIAELGTALRGPRTHPLFRRSSAGLVPVASPSRAPRRSGVPNADRVAGP
jgi:Flp pilus assembly CpaF family ATPase